MHREGSKLHREQFADTSHLEVCRRRRVVSLLTCVMVGSRVAFTFVAFWVCFPDLLKNPAYFSSLWLEGEALHCDYHRVYFTAAFLEEAVWV